MVDATTAVYQLTVTSDTIVTALSKSNLQLGVFFSGPKGSSARASQSGRKGATHVVSKPVLMDIIIR
jgi:hypothetical protein